MTIAGNRFSDWLAAARVTDNAVGDFISDARQDSRLPPDFASLRELKGYLRDRGACPEAIDAGTRAWRRYRDWVKRRYAGFGARP